MIYTDFEIIQTMINGLQTNQKCLLSYLGSPRRGIGDECNSKSSSSNVSSLNSNNGFISSSSDEIIRKNDSTYRN